ncbi:uncharacterized protein LOC133323828 [Musca vetustissima]|uniref:uncharacterized protein LOC133323828 n=1 Tax=Musca vetustissima TaxID=27455 RepID=UPI002AB6D314|nr:uncharacterized protein LOC133323828 [Musca vetustissima]
MKLDNYCDSNYIYPILGSLLGVDTSNTSHNNNNNNGDNSNEQSPNNSNNDLFHSYGYLNNNTAAASNLLERDDYMQCKHCKRFYKSMQKLQEHVRKYCLKEKKYKCVSCEYRSRRKDHVLRHAKRKHCELYEQYRDDEDALFVIRTEDDGEDGAMGARYDTDVDYDAMEDYLVPSVTMGIGSGSVVSGNGGGGNNMEAMGFKFGCRDLTITAVPIMQESEDDDDDYDEDD